MPKALNVNLITKLHSVVPRQDNVIIKPHSVIPKPHNVI